MSLVLLALFGAGLIWAGGTSEAKKTADKPPVLKIRMFYHGEIDKTMAPNNVDFNNNRIANFHRVNSGVNVVFEPALADGTQESQKKAMILASNDTPDLMDMSRTEYYKYAMQGVFAETEPYLSKMPDYTKLVPQDVLNAPRFKGKLYCFPSVLEEQDLNRTHSGGVMVRKDVLDSLGIAAPRNLEEYYAMWKAVKGKTKYIPLTVAGSGDGFANAFSAIKAAYRVALDYTVKGDKLEFIWVQPEFKAYLTYMNRLYAEQLLDNEYITLNTTRLTEKLMGDQAFSSIQGWAYACVNVRDIGVKVPKASFAFTPQPSGPADAKALLYNNWPVQRMWVVPVAAKNKDAAAKFMNYMATPQSKMVQDYGIQGTDYTLGTDGKPVFTPAQQSAVTWKICYEVMATPASFKVRLVAKGYDWAYNQALAGQKDAEITSNILAVLPNDDTYQKVEQKLALKTFVDEETAKFISGARPVAEFDKFVAELEKKGLPEQTAALNAWFQANKAK